MRKNKCSVSKSNDGPSALEQTSRLHVCNVLSFAFYTMP